MTWHCWYSSATVRVWLLVSESFCSELNAKLQFVGGRRNVDCWSSIREEPERIKLFFKRHNHRNLRFNGRGHGLAGFLSVFGRQLRRHTAQGFVDWIPSRHPINSFDFQNTEGNLNFLN